MAFLHSVHKRLLLSFLSFQKSDYRQLNHYLIKDLQTHFLFLFIIHLLFKKLTKYRFIITCLES